MPAERAAARKGAVKVLVEGRIPTGSVADMSNSK